MEISIKNQIKALRNEGYGYGKIAELLKLSKSQVSSYCRRNNLNNDIDSSVKYCIYCGTPITKLAHHKERKFCSDRCKSKFYNELYKKTGRITEYNLICQNCGKEFISKGKKNQHFCSHHCYITHRYKGGVTK